jgi:hypothetical protein
MAIIAADKSATVEAATPISPIHSSYDEKPVSRRQRLKRIIWDTFDYSPEERWFIFKIDFFILYALANVKHTTEELIVFQDMGKLLIFFQESQLQ